MNPKLWFLFFHAFRCWNKTNKYYQKAFIYTTTIKDMTGYKNIIKFRKDRIFEHTLFCAYQIITLIFLCIKKVHTLKKRWNLNNSNEFWLCITAMYIKRAVYITLMDTKNKYGFYIHWQDLKIRTWYTVKK